jgi:drug/metabolite transporter (DMT)-like permease
VLGLLSALTWGSGDFAGGLLSRRAPVLGVVAGSQLVGTIAALILAAARSEPVPHGTDLAWAVAAGTMGVIGITSLYRGLAVGRMGVVAPATGVLAAVVPVVAGFVLQGVPRTEAVAGIGVALVAVVLVTRAPGHDDGRRSGIEWGLLAGIGIGGFNTCVGQLSGAGAFGPLVIIRLVEAAILVATIVSGRRAWRIPRGLLGPLVAVGLLDMGGNGAFILAVQAGQLAIAAMLSSLYPVVTVLLAIVVLRERVTRAHVAGIALTGLAIGLIAAGTARL